MKKPCKIKDHIVDLDKLEKLSKDQDDYYYYIVYSFDNKNHLVEFTDLTNRDEVYSNIEARLFAKE